MWLSGKVPALRPEPWPEAWLNSCNCLKVYVLSSWSATARWEMSPKISRWRNFFKLGQKRQDLAGKQAQAAHAGIHLEVHPGLFALAAGPRPPGPGPRPGDTGPLPGRRPRPARLPRGRMPKSSRIGRVSPGLAQGQPFLQGTHPQVIRAGADRSSGPPAADRGRRHRP